MTGVSGMTDTIMDTDPLRAASYRPRLAREIGHGLVLLGLTGSSVGGLVGVVTLAARVLGR